MDAQLRVKVVWLGYDVRPSRLSSPLSHQLEYDQSYLAAPLTQQAGGHRTFQIAAPA